MCGGLPWASSSSDCPGVEGSGSHPAASSDADGRPPPLLTLRQSGCAPQQASGASPHDLHTLRTARKVPRPNSSGPLDVLVRQAARCAQGPEENGKAQVKPMTTCRATGKAGAKRGRPASPAPPGSAALSSRAPPAGFRAQGQGVSQPSEVGGAGEQRGARPPRNIDQREREAAAGRPPPRPRNGPRAARACRA